MSPTPSISSSGSPKPQKPLIRRVRSGIHNVFHHNHDKCHKDYCNHYERQRRVSSYSSSRSSTSTSPPQTPPQRERSHSTLGLPPSSPHKLEASFSSIDSSSFRGSTKIDESWIEEAQSIDYSVPGIVVADVHPKTQTLASQPPSDTPPSKNNIAGSDLVKSPEQVSTPPPGPRPPGLVKFDKEYFPLMQVKETEPGLEYAEWADAGSRKEIADGDRPPPRTRCFSDMGVGTQDDLEPKKLHVRSPSEPGVTEKQKVDETKEVEAPKKDVPLIVSEEDGALDFRRQLISHGAFCVCGFIFVRTFVLLFGRK